MLRLALLLLVLMRCEAFAPRLCAPLWCAPSRRTPLRPHMQAEHPLSTGKLLHAMIRVPAAGMDSAVAFWEERGARVLSRAGKGSCFVGYGEYRDATFFALELAPVPGNVVNNDVSYFGLSLLPAGSRLPAATGGVEEDAAAPSDPGSRFAAFMEDRKRRTPPGGMMPLACEKSSSNIEVRSVASAPGDPFARFVFAVADPDASARFYCETLGMSEVFRNEVRAGVSNANPPKQEIMRIKKLGYIHAHTHQ